YPKGLDIPKDITPPEGNCFKFSLFTSGFLWYKCTNHTWVPSEARLLYFNDQNDTSSYPCSAVASTFNVPAPGSGIRSIIPKDNSSLVVTTVAEHPTHDSKDLPWALGKASDNEGEEAFEDITFLVRVNTCGGVVPSNVKCGSDCSEGHIYSTIFSSLVLFYHHSK
ncbi:29875_t:CDS:2, partial [Racocetra persica]